MRCRDVLRRSSEYIDGELDHRRSSAIRGHLRTCTACARAVEEEAKVRAAAADLDAALDPPPSLWAGIEQRLAEEEIADSHRSPLWLLWPRVRDKLPYALVACAAAGALAVWLARDRIAEVARPAEAPARAAPEIAEQRQHIAPDAEPLLETHLEQAMGEIRKADERYLTAIAELRGIADTERASWPRERAAAFEARLAELEESALEQHKRLAAREDAATDPRFRTELYEIYRQQIDLLQAVAVNLDPEEAW
jgi:hypothetical protein